MRLEKEAVTRATNIDVTVRILGFYFYLDFHLTQTTLARTYAHVDIIRILLPHVPTTGDRAVNYSHNSRSKEKRWVQKYRDEM